MTAPGQRIADEARFLSRDLGFGNGDHLLRETPMFGLIFLLVYASGAKTPPGVSAALRLIAHGARDDLDVIADELQSSGARVLVYPVGELLALWNAKTSCTMCTGGRSGVTYRERLVDWTCRHCDGTGLACAQRVIEILDGGR